ncbi:MAG: hypothetical protein MK209_06760 [Planctomycetes bacterium]|nr:hypothetical protein [Planctomycetota bacterium]
MDDAFSADSPKQPCIAFAMNLYTVGLSLVLTLTLLTGCGDTATDFDLKAQLKRYEESILQRDFRRQATTLPPSVVEEAGGLEKMAQLLEEGGSVFAQTGSPTQIVQAFAWGERGLPAQDGSNHAEAIPFTTQIDLPGDVRIQVEMQMIAISQDRGESWHLIQGNKPGIEWLTERSERLITDLKINRPKMTIWDNKKDPPKSVFFEVDGVWKMQHEDKTKRTAQTR